MNLGYWLRHPRMIVPRVKFWIFERRNPEKPWLCEGTIAYLDRALSRNMCGVEFGSGRSTQWLAARMGRLLSIEQSPEWFTVVTEQLRHAGIANVDIRLILLEHPLLEPERDTYDPLPAYVGVLEEFEDISLDFVFVDGHYRTTCIKAAPAKLRSGGLLAVDDTNMWDASGGPPVPATWRCVDSSTNGIKTAKIWQKP